MEFGVHAWIEALTTGKSASYTPSQTAPSAIGVGLGLHRPGRSEGIVFTHTTQDYERIPHTKTRTPREQGKARTASLRDAIFNDEDAALKWLAELRWGLDGQVCPFCGDIDHHYWLAKRRLWKCRAKQCGRQFSIFTGTKFHATSLKPSDVTRLLLVWQESAEGMSSRELAGLIGLNYRATHFQVMKLREALVQTQDTTPLTGIVEVDAAYFCRYVRPPNKGTGTSYRTKAKSAEGKEEAAGDAETTKVTKAQSPVAKANDAETAKDGKYLQNPNMHALVAFVQRLPDGMGIARIRVAVVKTETQVDVLPLTLAFVDESATVLTDEHGAYTPVIAAVADHARIRHKNAFVDEAGVHTNHVECYFGEMRRAQQGAFHSMGLGYLIYYATEIAWRLEMRDKPNHIRLEDLARRVLRSGRPVQFADMSNKRPKAGKPKVEKPAVKGLAFEIPKASVKQFVIAPTQPQRRRKKRYTRNAPRPSPGKG